MPKETRVFISGMDSDTENRLLPKEKCRELFMIRPGRADGKNGVAWVERGTEPISYTLPTGNNVVVGEKENFQTKNIIYLVANDTGNHSILEFDVKNEIISEIFAPNSSTNTEFLGFDVNKKIHSINIFDNNLTWVNDDFPKHLNIESARGYMNGTPSSKDLFVYDVNFGLYNPKYQAQYISAGKYPPLFPPTWEYGTDTTRKGNLLRGKMFQFRYRYVYPDKSKSTFSPISKVTLPQNEESALGFFPGNIEKNNYLKLNVNLGHSTVTHIELAYRIGNDGEWYLITDKINKVDENNQKILPDGINYNYNWYGDSVGYVLPDDDTSPNSYQVPLTARVQEVTSDNKIIYGNYVKGFNNLDISVDSSVVWTELATPSVLISGVAVTSPTPNQVTLPASSADIPVGSVIQMTIQAASDPGYDPAASGPYDFLTYNAIYKVVDGDLTSYPTTLLDNMVADLTAKVPTSVVTFTNTGTTLQINTAGATNAKFFQANGFREIPEKFASVKKGASEKLGIVYFDEQGRHGGVQTSDDLDVYNKWYSEEKGGTAWKNWGCHINLVIKHPPPDWAVTYQIVTAGSSIDSFISGKGTFFDVPTDSETGYSRTKNALIIDEFQSFILNNNGVEYSYQEGDQIRFSFDGHGGNFYTEYITAPLTGYDVGDKRLEFEIDAELIIELAPGASSYSNTHINFEIYRNKPINNEINYNEIGEVFEIIETGGVKYHGGNVRNQSGASPAEINLSYGNSYIYPIVVNFYGYYAIPPNSTFADRLIFDTGNYLLRAEQPFFSKLYSSEYTDVGRFHAYNENFIQKRYFNRLITGGEYYKDTETNNIFDVRSNNEFTVGVENGEIQRIIQVQFTLKIIQERRITSGYINRRRAFNPGGTDSVVLTDDFIGELQESIQDWGTEHPTSVIKVGRYLYFWDARNGIVVRDDANGPDDITVGKRVFTNDARELSSKFRDGEIISGYDKDADLVYFSFKKDEEKSCVSYYKSGDYWNSYHPYWPDLFSSAGNKFISFKNGELWIHHRTQERKFHGVKHNAKVRTVFNENPKNSKTFLALSIHSNKAWYGPNKGDIKTEDTEMFGVMETRLIKSKLHYQERVFYSDIPRDMNTKNVSNPIINGDKLIGSVLDVTLINDDDEDVSLFAIDANYINNTEI